MIKKGFTLLELMITLSIIGILATLAYPLHSQHVAKTERHQAKLSLLQLAVQLEHYRTENGSYQGAKKNILTHWLNHNPAYIIKIEYATEDQFLISANPKKTTDSCGRLLINHIGHQQIMESTQKISTCWSL